MKNFIENYDGDDVVQHITKVLFPQDCKKVDDLEKTSAKLNEVEKTADNNSCNCKSKIDCGLLQNLCEEAEILLLKINRISEFAVYPKTKSMVADLLQTAEDIFSSNKKIYLKFCKQQYNATKSMKYFQSFCATLNDIFSQIRQTILASTMFLKTQNCKEIEKETLLNILLLEEMQFCVLKMLRNC